MRGGEPLDMLLDAHSARHTMQQRRAPCPACRRGPEPISQAQFGCNLSQYAIWQYANAVHLPLRPLLLLQSWTWPCM